MQETTPDPPPLVKLEHVAMRYDAIGDAQGPAVLEDICLELTAGDSLAIVGPSGSGKSTLLNIMGTLDRPTGGSAWLDGRDLAQLTDTELAEIRNQRIGFVFQEHHLLPQCTVLENVLVPTLVGPAVPGSADRARQLLARVDLSDRLHHRPGELSGGQRQRVAVVRALINQPDLLLADEPTGSLDRASAQELSRLLLELNRESGVTLVTVTHSRDLAISMARRLELRNGGFIGHGAKAMTRRHLIYRSLAYYWRTNLGVAAGAAVATAVLVGALAVGDSVRFSLRKTALARLGSTHLALSTADRYFTRELADRIQEGLARPTAAVLDLGGLVSADGGRRRANAVRVLGVDRAFWQIGSTNTPFTGPDAAEIALSTPLAVKLGAAPGDRVLVRMAKPSALSRDIALGSEVEDSVTLNLTVSAVLDEKRFGRFALHANQIPPLNAFVPQAVLHQAAGIGARANILLVAAGSDQAPDAKSADTSLRSALRLEDAQAHLKIFTGPSGQVPDSAAGIVPGANVPPATPTIAELRTDRIFLDPYLAEAAQDAVPGSLPILTYFVNQIETTTGKTRYAMVSAMPASSDGRVPSPVPPNLADDQIVVNRWLADHRGAEQGQAVNLSYFVFGPARKLEQRTARFAIAAVTPTEAPGADRHLMPDFPGLTEFQSSREWQPPPELGIDTKLIADDEETYWDEHRGTPKAFVALPWARKNWGNRYGDLTAIRWSAPGLTSAVIERKILDRIDPPRLGFVFRPVRAQALAASAQGTDFGGLFVGLSFFLVVAALVLTAMLFGFGILQRSSETGSLLALGFTARRVRRLRLQEGLFLAGAGALVGLLLGVLYTRAVLWALGNLWQGAVAGVTLDYHASWATLLGGVAAGLLVATASMLWILWRQGRSPARALLQSRFGLETTGQARRRPSVVAGLALVLAAGTLVTLALGSGPGSAALVFFAAGALVLLGGLCLARSFLVTASRGGAGHFTSAGLARRNTTRRRGRSLAVITMLACGTFLLVAVNAFRIDPTAASDQRDSGTGGYALFATTVLPVHEDLNSTKGRSAFSLSDRIMADTFIQPMRLRPGDDASCLNLNRPGTPALLGVDPAALQTDANSRFSFARESAPERGEGGWKLLEAPSPEQNVIPGIVEDSVATYILHKKLGETLDYIDEHGQPFKIRIVATTSNTILQGHVVISEEHFQRRFPSTSGYRVFLVDAPGPSAPAVQAELERGLADVGIDAMTAVHRLALFSRVQNTYLTIFGILGGLGLVLGCVGLGLVVLRNVLERRHEFALLRCLGFGRGQLRWLVLAEHWGLLLLGLAIGAISALIAAAPALTRPGAHTPKLLLALTMLGILASGLFWSGLAATAALRGKLITALRQE